MFSVGKKNIRVLASITFFETLYSSHFERMNRAKLERLGGKATSESVELDRKTEELLKRCDELLGEKSPPAPLPSDEKDFFVSPETSVDEENEVLSIEDESLPPPGYQEEAATQTAVVDSATRSTQTTTTTKIDAGVQIEREEEEVESLLADAAEFCDDIFVSRLVDRIRELSLLM